MSSEFTPKKNEAFLEALPQTLRGFDFEQNEPKSIASELDRRIAGLIEERQWDGLEAFIRELKRLHDERVEQRQAVQPEQEDPEGGRKDRGRFTWYIRVFRAILGFHREAYDSAEFNQKKTNALAWIARGFSARSGTALNIALNVNQFDVAEALYPKEDVGLVESEAFGVFLKQKPSVEKDVAFSTWWVKSESRQPLAASQLSQGFALLEASRAGKSSIHALVVSWTKNWVAQKSNTTSPDEWWKNTACLSAELSIEGAVSFKAWMDTLKTTLSREDWKCFVSGKIPQEVEDRHANTYGRVGSFSALSGVKTFPVVLEPEPKGKRIVLTENGGVTESIKPLKWVDWCLSHGLTAAAEEWEALGARVPTEARLKRLLKRNQETDFAWDSSDQRDLFSSYLERKVLILRTKAVVQPKRSAPAL
jgi:hypothetical protein